VAVAALVVGIIAVVFGFVFVAGILAIILGLVAIGRASRSGGRTRALGIAGALLGVLSLGLGAIEVVGLVNLGQHYRTFDTLDAGDCFNVAHDLIPHYNLVNCGSPHDGEAYAVIKAQESGSYPGVDGFGADDPTCAAARQQYVDGNLNTSIYQPVTLVPNELAWDRGVRRLVCIVQSADGNRLTGSVRGTGGNAGPLN
jgi:hypothetical protein